MTTDAQTEQPAADADAPTMAPEAALTWLDTAIEEFQGSVEEASRHIAAGSLPAIEVSARLNTFMLWLMSIAQTGQDAIARGDVTLDAEGAPVVPE